jgi:hypothetical protein
VEIGTQHKYNFDILLDYKPEESILRPEASKLMRQRAAERDPSAVCPGAPRGGIPAAGLLSEPLEMRNSPIEQ